MARRSWHCTPADLHDAAHCQAIVYLTDAYAQDQMGMGKPFSEEHKAAMVPALRAHDGTRIFLCFDGDKAVGIANCFLGFSTFYAQPLINIHDLAVLPAYRHKGVGTALLETIEDYARNSNCCKLTLEVRSDNQSAMDAYRKFGFSDSSEHGYEMYFWDRKL